MSELSSSFKLINAANVVPAAKQPLAMLLVGSFWRYWRR